MLKDDYDINIIGRQAWEEDQGEITLNTTGAYTYRELCIRDSGGRRIPTGFCHLRDLALSGPSRLHSRREHHYRIGERRAIGYDTDR